MLKDIFPLKSTDITMTTSKLGFVLAQGTLFHSFLILIDLCAGVNLLFPFAEGAAIVLFEDFAKEEQLFEYLLKYKPTVFAALPYIYSKILTYQVYFISKVRI